MRAELTQIDGAQRELRQLGEVAEQSGKALVSFLHPVCASHGLCWHSSN